MQLSAAADAVSSYESVPGMFRRDAKRSWHQARRHRSVSRLLKGLRGDVLDYGCGYGDITDLISKTHSVVGCDVDPRRVGFAASQYPGIRWTSCEPLGTSFHDQSFGIVLSAVVIHFVPDPWRYLAEVHRLLTPGGTLVILCQNQPVMRNAVRRALGRGNAPTSLWVPTIREMEAIIAASGFDILKYTYFYDPPFEPWKRVGDCVFGVAQQVLSVLGVSSTAEYYGYAAQKRPIR